VQTPFDSTIQETAHDPNADRKLPKIEILKISENTERNYEEL